MVLKETPLSARLVNSLWLLEPVGHDGFRHSRQTHKHKSCIPCPIFGESRFLGNSQIPDPVNIFIVFPIPAPYFGQIPNPENTLPDPLTRILTKLLVASLLENTWASCGLLTFCHQIILESENPMKNAKKIKIILLNAACTCLGSCFLSATVRPLPPYKWIGTPLSVIIYAVS